MEKMLLICQQCGGTLEITEDIELFKCKFCDTPYLVKREGGAVHVQRLEKRVEKLEVAQTQMRGSVAAMELEKLLKDRQTFMFEWKNPSEDWTKSAGLRGRAPLRNKYLARPRLKELLATMALLPLGVIMLSGLISGSSSSSAEFFGTVLCGLPFLVCLVYVVRQNQLRTIPAKEEYARRIAEFNQRETELRAQIEEGKRTMQPA